MQNQEIKSSRIDYEINIGAMENQDSMESATVTINMDIQQVNARRNLSLEVNATIARNQDTNLLNAKPRY